MTGLIELVESTVDEFESTLDGLLRELARLHPSFIERLGPPASSEDFSRAEGLTGTRFPEQIRRLYTRHNGQRDNLGNGVFFGADLLRLDQIAEEYRALLELRDSGIVQSPSPADPRLSEDFPGAGHIPFLADGSGNYVGFDVRPGPSGTFGQILVFGADLPEAEVVFPSLSEMLAAVLNQLRSGNFILREDLRMSRHPWLEFVSGDFSPLARVLYTQTRPGGG